MTTRRDVDLFLKSGNDIMRPRVRISRVSTIVVDADDRDRLFVRVDTDEPEVGWGDSSAHPGRSPRPHLRSAPDGGLLDW